MQGSDNRRSDSADILQRVAAFLRSLTPKELEELASGRAQLSLASRNRKRSGPEELSPKSVEGIIRKLRSLGTREDGSVYLAQEAPARAHLVQIAVAMDVPAPKSDTVTKLRERLVETAIGYRLRSDAIRGTDRETRHEGRDQQYRGPRGDLHNP